MGNLKRWIEEQAGREPIEAAVIGSMGGDSDYDSYSGSEGVPNYAGHPRGRVLTWEEAAPHLDYGFDDGFGDAGCEAIWAWTATKVIAISKYDGSTEAYALPRHPSCGTPRMAGGG